MSAASDSGSLSATAMMAEAERLTGLRDWGGELFRKPFETLVHALNTEAGLHELGVRRTYRRLLDNLSSRLRIVSDRKLYPGVAAEPVVRPLFVIGLPRAGTTFWLDPVDNLCGVALWRWYLAERHPTPSVRRMPATEVRNHLPAATPFITPEERRRGIQQRTSAVRRRFGF